MTVATEYRSLSTAERDALRSAYFFAEHRLASLLTSEERDEIARAKSDCARFYKPYSDPQYDTRAHTEACKRLEHWQGTVATRLDLVRILATIKAQTAKEDQKVTKTCDASIKAKARYEKARTSSRSNSETVNRLYNRMTATNERYHKSFNIHRAAYEKAVLQHAGDLVAAAAAAACR